MQLRGWKYTGRVINDNFQEQIKSILDLLNDKSFVNHDTWPSVQRRLAAKLGVEAGQIRTLKKMMEEFGLVTSGSLNAREEVEADNVITENGRLLIHIIDIENSLYSSDDSGNTQLKHKLKKMIKDFYSRIILENYLPKGGLGDEDKPLHCLRAVIMALRRYKTLDFYEWYILNTLIKTDEDTKDFSSVDKVIEDYRSQKIVFSKKSIVQFQLSHSYIAGNLEYGGFIKIARKPFVISENLENVTVNDSIISEGFLEGLYNRG
ncbi:MAG: hypothetical protein JXR88_14620 [Clostridia bacterium]|nr:hypothetical protein [Clostridia bacterium]